MAAADPSAKGKEKARYVDEVSSRGLAVTRHGLTVVLQDLPALVPSFSSIWKRRSHRQRKALKGRSGVCE